MPRVELYTLSDLPSGRLSVMARPRGGEWLGDEILALRQAGVDVLVSLLTPAESTELDLVREAEWCDAHGVRFLSLPIEDRGLPESYLRAVDLLGALNGDLGAGRHVAVHCRQGIGRSSLIAASLLTMLGFSAERAFELVAAARGRPVPDTEEQRAWVAAFAERAANMKGWAS